jgi:hypothetical protein
MKLSSIFEQYNNPKGGTHLVVSTLKGVALAAGDPYLPALVYLMKCAFPVCSLYVKQGQIFFTRSSVLASTLLTIVRYSI